MARPIIGYRRRAAVAQGGGGAERNLQDAADLLAQAKFPVIVSGGGVIFSGGVEACKALAERLKCARG